MTDVDALVVAYLLHKCREYAGPDDHLAECPEATVSEADVFDDEDEPGYEYTLFAATIRCPHGYVTDWEYGQFGVLAHLRAELEAEAGRLAKR